MKLNKTNAQFRAVIVMAANMNNNSKFDLEKSFFELTTEELKVLGRFQRIFNFSGKNNLGRSPLRQFYYHLQKGYKELKKEA